MGVEVMKGVYQFTLKMIFLYLYFNCFQFSKILFFFYFFLKIDFMCGGVGYTQHSSPTTSWLGHYPLSKFVFVHNIFDLSFIEQI